MGWGRVKVGEVYGGEVYEGDGGGGGGWVGVVEVGGGVVEVAVS